METLPLAISSVNEEFTNTKFGITFQFHTYGLAYVTK